MSLRSNADTEAVRGERLAHPAERRPRRQAIGLHFYSVTGTLLEAGPTTGAEIGLDPITPSFAQADDCLFGARAKAIVAFEAVAAGEAAARLGLRLLVGKALHHLRKRIARGERQFRFGMPHGFQQHRKIEHLE